MFEVFTVTLRESMEAAIVVAVILAYLSKTKRHKQKKFVYGGIIAALLASLAVVALSAYLKVELSPALEAALYIAAAAMITSMIFFMRKASKNLDRAIEGRIEKAFVKWQGTGVFLITFLMVFREGAETILLLLATYYRNGMLTLLEGAISLAIALLVAVMFVRGSLRISLKKFFKITTVMLIIVVFQLVVGAVEELEEAKLIPLGETGHELVELASSEGVHAASTAILILLLIYILATTYSSTKPKEKRK